MAQRALQRWRDQHGFGRTAYQSIAYEETEIGEEDRIKNSELMTGMVGTACDQGRVRR
jgi:hypothetical protein